MDLPEFPSSLSVAAFVSRFFLLSALQCIKDTYIRYELHLALSNSQTTCQLHSAKQQRTTVALQLLGDRVQSRAVNYCCVLNESICWRCCVHACMHTDMEVCSTGTDMEVSHYDHGTCEQLLCLAG